VAVALEEVQNMVVSKNLNTVAALEFADSLHFADSTEMNYHHSKVGSWVAQEHLNSNWEVLHNYKKDLEVDSNSFQVIISETVKKLCSIVSK